METKEDVQAYNELLKEQREIIEALRGKGITISSASYANQEAEERALKRKMNPKYKAKTIKTMKEMQERGGFKDCTEEDLDFDNVDEYDLEWYFINFYCFWNVYIVCKSEEELQEYQEEVLRIIVKMLNDEYMLTVYEEYVGEMLETFAELLSTDLVSVEQALLGK